MKRRPPAAAAEADHLGTFTKLALDIEKCQRYNPSLWDVVLNRSNKSLEKFAKASTTKTRKRARGPSSSSTPTTFPAVNTSTAPLTLSSYLHQPDMVREMLLELQPEHPAEVLPENRSRSTMPMDKPPPIPRPSPPIPSITPTPSPTKLPILNVVTPRTRQWIGRLPPPREADWAAINQLESVADDAVARRANAIDNLHKPHSLYGKLHHHRKSPRKDGRSGSRRRRDAASRYAADTSPTNSTVTKSIQVANASRLRMDQETALMHQEDHHHTPPLTTSFDDERQRVATEVTTLVEGLGSPQAKYPLHQPHHVVLETDHRVSVLLSESAGKAHQDATAAVDATLASIQKLVPLELIYAHGQGRYASMQIQRAMSMVHQALLRLVKRQFVVAWSRWQQHTCHARERERRQAVIVIQCAWRRVLARREVHIRRGLRRKQEEREKYLLRMLLARQNDAAACITRHLRSLRQRQQRKQVVADDRKRRISKKKELRREKKQRQKAKAKANQATKMWMALQDTASTVNKTRLKWMQMEPPQAATVIQGVWKGFKTRQRLKRQVAKDKERARRQSNRAKRQFVVFRRRRRAAVAIQSIARRFIATRRYVQRVQAFHRQLELRVVGQVLFAQRTLDVVQTQLLQLSWQYATESKKHLPPPQQQPGGANVQRSLYKRSDNGTWTTTGCFGLWQKIYLDICRHGNTSDAVEIDNMRFSRFVKEIPGMLHKSLCPLQNVDVAFAKFKPAKGRTMPFSAMSYLLTLRYPDKPPNQYTMEQRFLLFMHQLVLARFLVLRRQDEERRAATLLQNKWRQRLATLQFQSLVCDTFVEYVDWKSGACSYKNLVTHTTTYSRPALLRGLTPSVSIKLPPPGEEFVVLCTSIHTMCFSKDHGGYFTTELEGCRHETQPRQLATTFCLACEDAMCSDCFDREHKAKAFAAHTTTRIRMCHLCSKHTASRCFSNFHRKGQRQNHVMEAVSYLAVEAKSAQDVRLHEKELEQAEALRALDRLKDDSVRSAFTYKLRKVVGMAPVLTSDTIEEVQAVQLRKDKIVNALGLATYDHTKGCCRGRLIDVSTAQVVASGLVMVHVTAANKSVTLPLAALKPLGDNASPSKVLQLVDTVGNAAHKLQVSLLDRMEKKRHDLKLRHHRTEFKDLEEYAWVELPREPVSPPANDNAAASKTSVKPHGVKAMETMEPGAREDMQAQIQDAHDKLVKIETKSDRQRRASVDTAFSQVNAKAIDDALFWHDSLWSHPRVGKKARDLVKELPTDDLRRAVQLLARVGSPSTGTNVIDEDPTWEKMVLKFCALKTAEKKELLTETQDMNAADARAVLWSVVDPKAKESAADE
ncbi:hypothetical protein DYB25_006232 [Aphanomyces astaci]|uniref:B box-type domain-containing protein n=1 Tax=Aphanomyces astaci TaxID=112090 RepID=A0A397AQN3_APHAT|nr:hypothetical protein DYB25_006232 [Aphanomyces astaci]